MTGSYEHERGTLILRLEQLEDSQKEIIGRLREANGVRAGQGTELVVIETRIEALVGSMERVATGLGRVEDFGLKIAVVVAGTIFGYVLSVLR